MPEDGFGKCYGLSHVKTKIMTDKPWMVCQPGLQKGLKVKFEVCVWKVTQIVKVSFPLGDEWVVSDDEVILVSCKSNSVFGLTLFLPEVPLILRCKWVAIPPSPPTVAVNQIAIATS